MYTFTNFGDIVLPLYNRRSDQDPAPPQSIIQATFAGAFDTAGAMRAPTRWPHGITLEAVQSNDSAAAYRSSIDALRAAVGTRAELYRVADDDLTTQKCTARLLAMDYQREAGNLRHQRLKLQFAQLGPWRGKRTEDWVLDDGHFFDDGLYLDTGDVALVEGTNTVTVGGNLPIRNALLTITIDTATVAAVGVFVQNNTTLCSFVIQNAAYADGDVLVIDCGARTVTVDGVDAYADFTLDGANHKNENWLELAPGANDIGVNVIDSPAATVTIGLSYAEHWA